MLLSNFCTANPSSPYLTLLHDRFLQTWHITLTLAQTFYCSPQPPISSYTVSYCHSFTYLIQLLFSLFTPSAHIAEFHASSIFKFNSLTGTTYFILAVFPFNTYIHSFHSVVIPHFSVFPTISHLITIYVILISLITSPCSFLSTPLHYHFLVFTACVAAHIHTLPISPSSCNFFFTISCL